MYSFALAPSAAASWIARRASAAAAAFTPRLPNEARGIGAAAAARRPRGARPAPDCRESGDAKGVSSMFSPCPSTRKGDRLTKSCGRCVRSRSPARRSRDGSVNIDELEIRVVRVRRELDGFRCCGGDSRPARGASASCTRFTRRRPWKDEPSHSSRWCGESTINSRGRGAREVNYSGGGG
jgi:hypothetical protein